MKVEDVQPDVYYTCYRPDGSYEQVRTVDLLVSDRVLVEDTKHALHIVLAKNLSPVRRTDPELRESLAALEHVQWALWAKWQMDNDSPAARKRWQRQIDTPYPALTEKEKDSDREWADKVLATLEAHGVPVREVQP